MKHKTLRYILLLGAILIMATGCKKVLEEQPRTFFAPTFFSTPDGVQGGIAGIYSSFRGQWATQIWTQLFNSGTDESLMGAAADVQHWFTYNNPVIKSNTSNYEGFWNTLFIDINTANGVLEYGAAANLPAGDQNSAIRSGQVPAWVLLLLSCYHIWTSTAAYHFQYFCFSRRRTLRHWQTCMHRSLKTLQRQLPIYLIHRLQLLESQLPNRPRCSF
jgi:hypothetical protein